MDPIQEQRVWQRVFGQGEVSAESYTWSQEELLREMVTLAGMYRKLGNIPRYRPLMKGLHDQQLGMIRSLRGILALEGVPLKRIPPLVPEKLDSGQLLRRCCHKACRCSRELAVRSQDRETGPFFAELARTQGNHCARLTALLETEIRNRVPLPDFRGHNNRRPSSRNLP